MSKVSRHNRLRQNTSKEKTLPAFDFMHGLELCLKIIMAAILVSSSTLLFIFIENAITQSNLLAIKEISVSGTHILSKEEVIEQAEIFPEDNIFSINLRHTRLKIIAHPWIEDASVKRSLPSRIIINIREEVPLAVVHIPDRADIIINRHGVPFTENDAIGSDIYINNISKSTGTSNVKEIADKTTESVKNKKSSATNNGISMDVDADVDNRQNKDNSTLNESNSDNVNLTLPVITGLNLSKQSDIYGFSGRLYASVMDILLMKKTEVIQKIAADEESGIEIDMIINGSSTIKPALKISEEDCQKTVLVQQTDPLVKNPVKIKIGFDNYDEKFKIIRHIVNYMQKNKADKQVWSIDLINLENVVIKIKDITGNGLPEGSHALPEHIEGGA